jgi:hypothetical protein
MLAHCVSATFDPEVLLLSSYLLSDSFEWCVVAGRDQASRVNTLAMDTLRCRRRCHALNNTEGGAQTPFCQVVSVSAEVIYPKLRGAEEASPL